MCQPTINIFRGLFGARPPAEMTLASLLYLFFCENEMQITNVAASFKIIALWIFCISISLKKPNKRRLICIAVPLPFLYFQSGTALHHHISPASLTMQHTAYYCSRHSWLVWVSCPEEEPQTSLSQMSFARHYNKSCNGSFKSAVLSNIPVTVLSLWSIRARLLDLHNLS